MDASDLNKAIPTGREGGCLFRRDWHISDFVKSPTAADAGMTAEQLSAEYATMWKDERN